RALYQKALIRIAAVVGLAALIYAGAGVPAEAAGTAQFAAAAAPQSAAARDVALASNPCGDNFNHGRLIYHPAAGICHYFACIKGFWNQTNGYVMQCRDGPFSHSGGRRGSCSSHGGNRRALRAP